MKLVFGGAYQGKTALAMKKYDLSEADIEVCLENILPDFGKKCLSHIERFALYCVKNGLEPIDELLRLAPDIDEKIIISDDISCGVVPMDKTERAWREAEGRMMSRLAQRADEVTRVFCGLQQILKGAEK